MDNQRPSKSAPFNSIAAAADAASWKSRIAVPELLPSSCNGNSTDFGPLPQALKKSLTPSSVALHGNPRIYSLVPSSSPPTACFLRAGSTASSSAFRFFDALSSTGGTEAGVESESLSESESELLLSLSDDFFSTSILLVFLSSSLSELSESEESLESELLSSFFTAALAGAAFAFSSSSSESESESLSSFLTAAVAFLASSSLSESLLLLLLLSESLLELSSAFLASALMSDSNLATSSANFSAFLRALSAAFFASLAALSFALSSFSLVPAIFVFVFLY
mmetsp:Transcript_10713/g.22258  ORF Transcript_10713/g.22258 Transcript_10713/m.22258 type:complete len:281 (+) Transcript_10713:1691-2533(+)